MQVYNIHDWWMACASPTCVQRLHHPAVKKQKNVVWLSLSSNESTISWWRWGGRRHQTLSQQLYTSCASHPRLNKYETNNTSFLLLFLLSRPTNQMSNEHASLVYEAPVTVHRRGNLFHANWCNSRVVYTACQQRADEGGMSCIIIM